jgi:hypothetical protein
LHWRLVIAIIMQRFNVRQNFQRGSIGSLLVGHAAEGLKTNPQLVRGIFDDHIQPYAIQSPSNQTYVADISAYAQRRLKADASTNRAQFYPSGQASEYGIHKNELVFKDASAQQRASSQTRQNRGSLLFIETHVFSVFNGLQRNTKDIEFLGVCVSGWDGQAKDPSSLPLVTVACGGTANVRNTGDFHFQPGDRAYWDWPSMSQKREPMRRSQADAKAGLLRFIPDIVKLNFQSCNEITLFICGRAREFWRDTVDGGGETTDAVLMNHLRETHNRYSLSAYRETDNMAELLEDAIVLYEATIILALTQEQGAGIQWSGALTNAFEVLSRQQGMFLAGIPRDGLSASMIAAYMQGYALNNIRDQFQSKFIGTVQNVSAPNDTLQIMVKQ